MKTLLIACFIALAVSVVSQSISAKYKTTRENDYECVFVGAMNWERHWSVYGKDDNEVGCYAPSAIITHVNGVPVTRDELTQQYVAMANLHISGRIYLKAGFTSILYNYMVQHMDPEEIPGTPIDYNIVDPLATLYRPPEEL
jgi:hypothetical protein